MPLATAWLRAVQHHLVSPRADMAPCGAIVLLNLDGILVSAAAGLHPSCRAALQTLGHSPRGLIDLSGLIGPTIVRIRTHPARDAVDQAATAWSCSRQFQGSS